MRKIFILILVTFTLRVSAQTNGAVRLALVSESDDAGKAVDIMTAELSSHTNLQLLERTEIERVYKEQGLSSANGDYLKLGQVLGADGLLLLKTFKQTTNQILNIRLVATKPGVVLLAETFTWPIQNTAEWSKSMTRHLAPYLPKLTVALKDSIPLSIVNLRSAVGSAEGREIERAMKVLTIQRLTREPQLFILERQRMELLAEEKALKADDSPFWKGSYLLEGVIDQNGYSRETVTINARLTPPKGGSPLLFELKGNRANLAEVANQLAGKVHDALKINSAAPAWNATDEARQYFDEAKWALKWGDSSEAQQAAESAWALGRHDAESAMLRVQAYMVSPDAGKVVVYYPPREHPDPQNIASVQRGLDIYNESSRNLSPVEPKLDSEWYRLGLQNLTVVSRVLQVFGYSPEYYEPVSEQLSELRASARSTAEWISRSPSVHDSYFVGDRIVVYDEIYHFEEKPSIFSLKLDCGCLWQEKPEDCVALYRDLMSSPVFCYFHDRFWFRDTYHNGALLQAPPRLIAWNRTDEKRIPTVWNNFLREMNASSNVLWQLEAKATQLAEATNETVMARAFTNFFNSVFENRDALVSNNVEILYLEWHIGDLIERIGGGFASDTKDSLARIYNSEYRPKLMAMDEEFRRNAARTLAATKNLDVFEKQKKYLKEGTPFEPQTFVELFIFGFKDYSTNQALEIQPLLAAYKIKLDGKWAKIGALQIGQAENNVNRILNPPTPRPQPTAQSQAPKPVAASKPAEASPISSNSPPEIITNVITVSKFLPIPMEGLPGDRTYTGSTAQIQAHHWFESRLVLDFQYEAVIYPTSEKDNWVSRTVNLPAIAILNPMTEHWDIVSCPETDMANENKFYHRTLLLHGELFNCDGGQIKEYDFQKRQWNVLPISDGANYELFAVDGRLYAANQNVILEIVEGGKTTRILASTRRQPPASRLDAQGFGLPVLFEGPNHSLRISAPSNIFTWTNNDWQANATAVTASLPPEIFASGLLFRQRQNFQNPEVRISLLANGANEPELCLWKKTTSSITRSYQPSFQRPGTKPSPTPKSYWDMPIEASLPHSCAALRQLDLFFMVDHSMIKHVADANHTLVLSEAVAKDGYGATLYCFTHDLPNAQKVYLKFDSADGCPPGIGGEYMSPDGFDSGPPTWIMFGNNMLFFGLEKANKFIINGNQRMGIGCKTGVWILSNSQLDAAIAEQKRVRKDPNVVGGRTASVSETTTNASLKNVSP